MSASLGSVLEQDELSTAGPHGRLTVDVPEAWLAAGTVLELVVPARLTCARCEGGGCDACGRSGAIRLRGSDDERHLHITLSGAARGLRLIRPLGPDAGLDRLLVELRPAAVASELCRRVQAPRRVSLGPTFVVIGIVAALIAAFLLRR